MTYWKKLLLVVALLVSPAAARAENLDVKQRTARTACLAGDFAKGAALLSELFVASNDPVFIYNQGRCFEQNHRYEDAISRFQEFLRIGKKLKPDERAEAEKHIADCQDLLERQSGSHSATEAGGAASAVVGRAGTKEAKERAAKKACLAGDASAGVAILIDLYLDTNDTTYLFNQGRCLEQNRRYEDAIGRFREYLVKSKSLRADEKADTDKHIAACESYLKGSKAPEAAKPAEVTKPAVEPQPVVQRAPAQEVISLPAGSSGGEGAGLRTAGLTVAAVGGAGLVAGLVLNLKVNSMTSDLEGNYRLAGDATRKNYKTAGWVAYGAGAVCLVGGAILYYLGWRRGQAASSVAVLPMVGPDLAGTSLVGAF
jgi:hypothetical protein